MEYNAEYTGEKFRDIAEVMGVDTSGMDQAAYRRLRLTLLSSFQRMWESLKSFTR